MKNSFVSLFFASSLAVTGSFPGCSPELRDEQPLRTSTFATQTSQATPVFMPATSLQRASLTKARAADWQAGSSLHTVFFTLREFLSSRDEGKVDRSNIYKLLTDVDVVFSNTASDADTIVQQEVVPPFAGLRTVLCDRAINDDIGKTAVAFKETEAEINAVISWIWSDAANKNEFGIATIQFNKTTRVIAVEMTYSVDYNTATSATDYNLRCNVNGNAETNEFEFKYLIGDTRIVAKGTSRGEGNYMLFKYAGPGEATRFIVVPGTADESYFMAQDTLPTEIYSSSAELPGTVSEYKAWVDSAAFLTSADLVTDVAVLNTGNPRQGTIYFNLQ